MIIITIQKWKGGILNLIIRANKIINLIKFKKKKWFNKNLIINIEDDKNWIIKKKKIIFLLILFNNKMEINKKFEISIINQIMNRLDKDKEIKLK